MTGQSQRQSDARGTPATVDPGWAWSPYEPSEQQPWNLRRAGHLWRRAGFGADWSQLQESLRSGPQATVDRLLAPPENVEEFEARFSGYEDAAGSPSVTATNAWWLRRMIETPHPLRERITLFWHDHFAVSHRRVKYPALISRHLQLLRRHALGDYRELLAGVSRDPAVFLSLNAEASRRMAPSTGLARQLLERWTIGPGNYEAKDVTDLARAWTGWFVLRNELKYFPREYDEGAKTILGQSGNWGAEDSLRIALASPAAARMFVRGLYRALISESEQPLDTFLQPLYDECAADFRVAGVVERMLRSNWFFSDAVFRSRVKSPVEFAVGLVRSLEGSVPTLKLAQDLAAMGQDLFDPPTQHGWAGGMSWINPCTMAARCNLAAELLAPGGDYGGKLNLVELTRRNSSRDAAFAKSFFPRLLLQQEEPLFPSEDGSSPAAGRGEAELWRAAVCRLACDPEYQLS